MAQATPVSVATAEPSARAGSKNLYPYGQLKIGARLTLCFAAFALLMIGGHSDRVAVRAGRGVGAPLLRSGPEVASRHARPARCRDVPGNAG
jgi:hypothetical protein